ncbi:MAG TPA: TonB family protein [Steroidobacter sp.]
MLPLRRRSVCLLALAATTTVTAQPAEPADQSAATLEVYKAPRLKKTVMPRYPDSERSGGDEGWVVLNLMVDPDGKPMEVTVVESTGIRAFEKEALRSVQSWTFEPAALGNQPIAAGTNVKVTFVLREPARGARSEFVRAYRLALEAINQGDRAQADLQIEKLKAHNLYEDAYLNLARYHYYQKWGTDAQSYDALRHAIAGEEHDRYLPKDTFNQTLQLIFVLQLKLNDLAGALDTWDQLQANGVSKESVPKLQLAVDQIKLLQQKSSPYSVAGTIGDGSSWFITLFKKEFEIEVVSGKVAEIKLRCDKDYVLFRYEPEMHYKVADRLDKCQMEVIGDPGTAFKLIQG